MKIAEVHLRSMSPYSQSRAHNIPREKKETADDHEKRTWRARIHVNEDGHVFMPPMALKLALPEASKFSGRQIPGRGKSTYTKHFEAGVLIQDGPVLHDFSGDPIKVDDVEGEWLFLNSDGVRGSGKRVWKCMPKIPEWTAVVNVYVLDDTITEDVFAEVLKETGNFIGIGRFRPRSGGWYGRFKVESIQWAEYEMAQAAE